LTSVSLSTLDITDVKKIWIQYHKFTTLITGMKHALFC